MNDWGYQYDDFPKQTFPFRRIQVGENVPNKIVDGRICETREKFFQRLICSSFSSDLYFLQSGNSMYRTKKRTNQLVFIKLIERS